MSGIKDIIVNRLENSPFTYEDLIEMIHDSVRERVDQNLLFNVSRMSSDDFRNKTQNGIVLVAFRNTDLLGTVCIHFYDDREGRHYAYHEHVFVRPESKRDGIGSLLYRCVVDLSQRNYCEYILSDTAIDATSSVKWHKKNGFIIVGL